MAKMKINGLDEYQRMIANLSASTPAIIKPALYDAAGIVYGAIRQQLEALPVSETWRQVDYSDYPQPVGIKATQKDGLIKGLGISKMDNKSGVITVRIGFDGYNDQPTKRFPNGEPNALVARELVLGTSRIPRINFIKNAVAASRNDAKKAIIESCEQKIDALKKKGMI